MISASSTIAIGVFDGVHLGHQALLREGVDHVITFRNHPASFFGKEIPLIMSLTARERFLKRYGVTKVTFLTFDETLRRLSALDFLLSLQRDYGFKELILGRDARFGKDRAGTPEVVEKLAQRQGFSVRYIAPVTDAQGIVISSTRIRTLLKEGRRQEALALLGHDLEEASFYSSDR